MEPDQAGCSKDLQKDADTAKRRHNGSMSHRYEIEQRPAALGGGWRLRLLEQNADGTEVEMGGGVFAPDKNMAADDAYCDAVTEGESWQRPNE